MSGSNPYIKAPLSPKPEKPFKITFVSTNSTSTDKVVVDVDPNHMPTSQTGLSGSILDIALASNVDIDHACGGVCACSTCHIYVKEGLESCTESTEDEEDQLDKAPGLTSKSRLACQCIPNGSKDLVIEIPNWNRNLVRE